MKQISNDHRSKIIKNLYINLLGRPADDQGLSYWYHTQISIEEIEVLIKNSKEFKQKIHKKHGSKEIKTLYQHILNREADEEGLKFWCSSSLTFKEIEHLFRESDEVKRIARPLKHRTTKYPETIAAHTVRPICEVVEEAFNISSREWNGSLHVHMPGKTGEILFLLGCLPSLREMIPRAKIIFHIFPHYIDVIKNVREKPDQIELLEYTHSALADSVLQTFLSSPLAGFEIRGRDLWVSAYRTNPWYIWDSAYTIGTFYRQFSDAIGSIPFSLVKPRWIPLEMGEKRERTAIALPNTNSHSSVRRIFPFSPDQWKNLADALKARGLKPVATGHKEDPSPKAMPGWEWINCDLVEAVTLVLNSEYLLGGNSGLVFATAAFGKAQTVILDERNWINVPFRYGLQPFKDIFNIQRVWAIFTPSDGSQDECAYQLALKVATEPTMTGGFTVGYFIDPKT